MTFRYKRRIVIELDVRTDTNFERASDPEMKSPQDIAAMCVAGIIQAVKAASAAVQGDQLPTIPDGIPVDLVFAPGVCHSCTWGDLLAAKQSLQSIN